MTNLYNISGRKRSHLFLKAIILLVINYGIEFFAIGSFLVFMFKGDIILSITIGLPVAVGILLQPWFIVFWMLPRSISIVITPAIVTYLTFQIYDKVVSETWFNRIENFLLLFKSVKGAIIIVAGLFAATVVCYMRYIDFPSLNKDIPRVINSVAEKHKLKFEQKYFYVISEFIDSECLWCAKVSGEQLDIIVRELKLSGVESSQGVPAAFYDMQPYWWKPSRGFFSVLAYTTDYFPLKTRGQDGLHVMITYDTKSGLLYAWIKDNF